MLVADSWEDFEVIDAGDGQKLERWGDIVLLRPDPQALWPAEGAHPAWQGVNARYHRSEKGGGRWEYLRPTPQEWVLPYKALRFKVKTLGFKHTGLFPEQAVNWDWMAERLAGRPGASVLNLFAYTGGASVACAAAGARVTHVDAARGMVQWAGENAALSGLAHHPIRYIVDDCLKFVRRERRRERRYDGIVMDPPAYGRGPGGEMWKLEDEIFTLVREAAQILRDDALFFVVNSYTTGLGALAMENMIKIALGQQRGGCFSSGEVCLPITARGLFLPCGNTARWCK